MCAPARKHCVHVGASRGGFSHLTDPLQGTGVRSEASANILSTLPPTLYGPPPFLPWALQVDSKQFPDLEAFPAAQRVTYKFYVGRLAVFDEDYVSVWGRGVAVSVCHSRC